MKKLIITERCIGNLSDYALNYSRFNICMAPGIESSFTLNGITSEMHSQLQDLTRISIYL
jgi:hypothetical protein